MRAVAIVLAAGSLMVGGALLSSVRAGPPPRRRPPAQPAPLKSVADFTSIQDPATRSLALFAEVGKVIESPRCMNCHPVQRAPTQGDDRHPHNPRWWAGRAATGRWACRAVPATVRPTSRTWGRTSGRSPAIRNGRWPRSRWPGRASRWARSAPDQGSRPQRRQVHGASCITTWPRTTWSAGPGIRARAAFPRRGHRRGSASW